MKQREYQDILNIESHEIECNNLSNEYNWALVAEEEASSKETQSQIDSLIRQISFVEEEKQAYQEQLNKIEMGQE